MKWFVPFAAACALSMGCFGEVESEDQVALDSTSQAARLPSIGQISVGTQYGCAVSTLFDTGIGGTVYCWGANGSSSAGGTERFYARAQRVSGIDKAIQVATGGVQTCALRVDGSVWCWGYRANFANSNQPTYATSAERVPGISDAMAISVAEYMVVALRRDGTVVVWGGGQGIPRVPTAVQNLSNVTAIDTGIRHACARLNDGSVRCFGTNASGVLGRGFAEANLYLRAEPVVGLPEAVIQISSGNTANCALTQGLRVFCWGWGENGSLTGTNQNGIFLRPTEVQGLRGSAFDVPIAITTNGQSSCARTFTGKLKCWGWRPIAPSERPTVIRPTGRFVETLATDIGMSMCITTTGAYAECWGMNDWYEVGDGTTINRTTPVNLSFQ